MRQTRCRCACSPHEQFAHGLCFWCYIARVVLPHGIQADYSACDKAKQAATAVHSKQQLAELHDRVLYTRVPRVYYRRSASYGRIGYGHTEVPLPEGPTR